MGSKFEWLCSEVIANGINRVVNRVAQLVVGDNLVLKLRSWEADKYVDGNVSNSLV